MELSLAADLLDDLLAAATAALDLTDEGAPTHVFVSHSDPPGDCDQLTVHTTGWTFEDGGLDGCFVIPTYTMVVTLLRCFPTVGVNGVPPSLATLSAAGRALATDAQALVRELGRGRVAGTLFPTADLGCAPVRIGDVVPVGPDGGLAGWTLTVAVVGAP